MRRWRMAVVLVDKVMMEQKVVILGEEALGPRGRNRSENPKKTVRYLTLNKHGE